MSKKSFWKHAGKKTALLLAALMLLGLFSACADARETSYQEPYQDSAAVTPAETPAPTPAETIPDRISRRSLVASSFTNLSFTPWDVESAVAQAGIHDKKPYTVMIYLNGSDLETENGMATSDLMEMIESGYNEDNVNVVILSGGTAAWNNDVIPSDTCALYHIAEGDLQFIDTIGKLNIGDAGTLSGFIDFCMTAFPADRYGLILWNHGGGSIAGYGSDEHFDNDGLQLLELNFALEESQAAEERLEFIGFDACLMATIETAVVAQDYANYLIASEELEPGYGWDYHWLYDLGANPSMNGAELGQIIADKFVAFYEGSDEEATLSVTDLSKVHGVLDAMGTLMSACNEDFSPELFKQVSKWRNNTKTFGGGSPRDEGCDMIDLAAMAHKFAEKYPDEAEALIRAVEDAVVYNTYSEGIEGAYGLSTYYVFSGKDEAWEAIETYRAMMMNPQYTSFLENFASLLTGESIADMDVSSQAPEKDADGNFTIKLTPDELDNLLEIYFTVWEPIPGEQDYYFMLGQSSAVEIAEDGTIETEFEGVWPGINGDFVCLYEISSTQHSRRYAIPAVLNGKDVDIIVVFDEDNPDGKIIGARPLMDDSTDMAAKYLLPIKDGDRIQFLYYAEYFGDDEQKAAEEWYEGETFTVKGGLKLEWLEVEAGQPYCYGFLIKDVQGNEYYTDIIEVEFLE